MGARTAKAGREQVLAAADTILLSGQRPTIEAIQARLGGGSPNSIVAYLKDWYGELGERLATSLAPAKGLSPEVHRAALSLQLALGACSSNGVEGEGTEELIRALRADAASLRLLLDELRIQRNRDQQALADARALLMQKDQQLQDLSQRCLETATQLALLQGAKRRSARLSPKRQAVQRVASRGSGSNRRTAAAPPKATAKSPKRTAREARAMPGTGRKGTAPRGKQVARTARKRSPSGKRSKPSR